MIISVHSELHLLYVLTILQTGWYFIAAFIKLLYFTVFRLWTKIPDIRIVFHYVIYCGTAFSSEVDSFAKTLSIIFWTKVITFWFEKYADSVFFLLHYRCFTILHFFNDGWQISLNGLSTLYNTDLSWKKQYEKCWIRSFFWSVFPVFGPEKTLYLDIFHVVKLPNTSLWLNIFRVYISFYPAWKLRYFCKYIKVVIAFWMYPT